MKFDVVVGNPPYQENINSASNKRTKSVYHHFYNLAKVAASRYCLISPARFISNSGTTSEAWNKSMLEDKHLVGIYFEKDSTKLFPNVDIKGGVAILYRDSSLETGGGVSQI